MEKDSEADELRSNWRDVYFNAKKDFNSQFSPLITAQKLSELKCELSDDLVYRQNADSLVDMFLGFANIDTSHHSSDDHTHVCIDYVRSDRIHIRPLSYKFNYEFYNALDIRKRLKIGITPKLASLREKLAENGKPHEIDGTLAPCKLGVSCMIVQGRPERPTAVIVTKRSERVAYFPGFMDNSFSGGVDIKDLTNSDLTFSDFITNGAIRECREELGIELSIKDIQILGLWYDLSRCSVQAFGVVFLNDLSALEIKPSEESATVQIKNINEGNYSDLTTSQGTPEYQFLLKYLDDRMSGG